ncbi:MAG: helix-turn-helix transcriptional regulator [Candidatus Geothermarchaeales archaeon]
MSSEEKNIIRFIFERGGRVLEAEIREEFDLPRTSVWRMAKRLEDMGIVVIRKVGLQNQIELRRS